MAAGRKRLRRIQLGKETTGGTAVAATTIWRGSGNMLDDQRTIEEVEEMIGVLDGADRDAVVRLLGMIDLGETKITFEQLQYLLVMGLGGSTTGSADGSGSDKIYTTNVPTTTGPTAVPYTLEGGDDAEVEQMEYCVCTKIVLKGTVGKIATMSATLMGRRVERLGSGFTGALTAPAVEEVVTGKGKVYIDAIGGTYGTTAVGQIQGFEVTIEIMWKPIFAMNGTLYYSYPHYVGHKITGKLTYLHDTAVSGNSGAKADHRNRTPRLLRVELLGNAVVTPGTTHNQKKIFIDLPIKYLKAGTIEEEDGVDIVSMEFRSRYNATAGNAGKIVVVSEVATLP